MIFIQWKKFITCLACLTPYSRLSPYDESELSHYDKEYQRILENKKNETIEDENISYFPLSRNYILNHINS